MNHEFRSQLSPEAYHVLREKGTEPPFSGALLHESRSGTYRCGACGATLFDSETKFDSRSGWPSFTRPADSSRVILAPDTSHGMLRTEISCAECHSHLGHVFDDGPVETGGKRFCVNSLSLEFKPSEKAP